MMMMMIIFQKALVVLLLCVAAALSVESGGRSSQEYGDALTKSILFFEGQRSGKLPSSQRVKWRGDSALTDGSQLGVDLVGGYYDAGDNVKFNFPMAFTTTMLSWSVIEFGKYMGNDDLNHARTSVRWATDYLLKSTSVPGFIFAQVGDAHRDHNCWERPEDMDTPRTPYAVSKSTPGSEVAGEIAAALAAASLVFKLSDHDYSVQLLKRAFTVFRFADIYRGTYNDSLGPWVCDFYCSYNGYKDELIWAAAWLFKATKVPSYGDYVRKHIVGLGGSFAEFGWDNKHAGINVLVSKLIIDGNLPESGPFLPESDKLFCSILPKSPYPSVTYSPAGLLFKPGGSNLQHVTSLSFLSLVYARYIGHSSRKVIHCPDSNKVIKPSTLIKLVKRQVDYILGDNPSRMSYMVGFGSKYPTKIHHRAASLPSIHQVPERIACEGGKKYFFSTDPDPNVLVGAVVGGPDEKDRYDDGNRADFSHSEPATYINAPFVGVLAYFKKYPFQT